MKSEEVVHSHFVAMCKLMNKYKHLTEKEEKKLIFLSKLKIITKKYCKRSGMCLAIASMFAVGAVSFYRVLGDKDCEQHDKICDASSGMSKGANNTEKRENTGELTQLGEKEFERESKKLESITADADDLIKEEAENQKSVGFDGDFGDWNKTCPAEMIVVNKNNFLNEDYVPEIKICRGKEVAAVACEDLEKMISDAKQEGIKLWISSGYRSIDLQAKLFNRQIDREKSKAVISQEDAEKHAAMVVARPGTSEHNTGLAVDFNGVEDNFYTTCEYKWLTDNAHTYGFIERYQEKWKDITGVIYEPWHFRYVGKETAKKIKESGLCLEEYIKQIHENNHEYVHQNENQLNNNEADNETIGERKPAQTDDDQ